VYKPLNLGLHAPVLELDATQLVRCHDGLLVPVRLLVLLAPPVLQRATPSLAGPEQARVLFALVVSWADGVRHNVHNIWNMMEVIVMVVMMMVVVVMMMMMMVVVEVVVVVIMMMMVEVMMMTMMMTTTRMTKVMVIMIMSLLD
jgi:hypothetical protein